MALGWAVKGQMAALMFTAARVIACGLVLRIGNSISPGRRIVRSKVTLSIGAAGSTCRPAPFVARKSAITPARRTRGRPIKPIVLTSSDRREAGVESVESDILSLLDFE